MFNTFFIADAADIQQSLNDLHVVFHLIPGQHRTVDYPFRFRDLRDALPFSPSLFDFLHRPFVPQAASSSTYPPTRTPKSYKTDTAASKKNVAGRRLTFICLTPRQHYLINRLALAPTLGQWRR